MFQHQGIWLPDGEKHFPQWMTKHGEIVDGKGTYQIKKYREAMKWCHGFNCALDVGAHVGLWSMHFVKRFHTVVAFEPVAKFRECFKKNVPASDGLVLEDCAIGSESRQVMMVVDPADTGGTHVGKSGDKFLDVTPINMVTLDWYLDGAGVDFLKIDCEGYEYEVLRGAEQTLKAWRPCVIVEQKPHKLEPNFGIKGKPAVDFLLSLGAKLRKEMGGDYIMSWDA